MARCVGAAAKLPESDRKDLAVQALAGSETVSDLAARHGVSRKFVYQKTHKARAALAGASRRWGAQWDDIADFQTAVSDNDALDHQLQDGLLFRQGCLSQAAADALAKHRHVGPHRRSLELLLA